MYEYVVAFHTFNTTQKNIKEKPYKTNKYVNSRIYRLKFLEYPLQYIEQRGCTFQERYKANVHVMQHNKDTRSYTQHIVNVVCVYGDINAIMDVVREKKVDACTDYRYTHLLRL
jgi:hypothetical protein